MTLKLENSEERLTSRTGLILANQFGQQLHLPGLIDEAFGRPGSNRGYTASDYCLSLAEMMIDGATGLEDIRAFEDDQAYKEMAEVFHYPSPDAIGDWLRRHGANGGEEKLWNALTFILRQSIPKNRNLVLDIDGTLIEADKGDALKTYKGFRGYHPVLLGSVEFGLFVSSHFLPGSAAPQAELAEFLQQCRTRFKDRFTAMRSDSAGYNSTFINYCYQEKIHFSITADLDPAVMTTIGEIPETAWKRGIDRRGIPEDYEVAETLHTMNDVAQAFRLVVKRTPKPDQQRDMFGVHHQYTYWIIATNLPINSYAAQAVIHFHEGRGAFEKMIGELKHYYGLRHLPCGQLEANSLYFTIGILAFTIIQLLKHHHFGAQWKNRSVVTLRYQWLHIPSRLITHARYTIIRLAMAPARFTEFSQVFLATLLAPPPALDDST
jgi:hypothetical protein